jgi:hypothetical protein
MTHVKITDFNPSHVELGGKLEELTDRQLSNILGGSTWHLYYAPSGRLISSRWENDGKDVIKEHRP